jgi:protein TonB
MLKEDAAPPTNMAGVAGMSGMGSSGGVLGGVMGGVGTGSPVVVKAAPKPTGPLHVSSGTMAGALISRPDPVYPPIAKAAHVQGAVILHAVISKQGTIENLTVVSGPQMLQGAAVDAVKRWKYKPYQLNGEPTEVDTTITVNFTFGGG